jgi:hypothetical protein
MGKTVAMTIMTAAMGGLLALACERGAARSPARGPSSDVTTTSGAGAPCARSDCEECDETKQKCMGPGVCGGHPEKASRQCTRDPDGKCTSKIVCETFAP